MLTGFRGLMSHLNQPPRHAAALAVATFWVPLIAMLPLASPAQAQEAVAPSQPNILFIFTDDHAAHAIGAYGGRLAELDPTPTLDRLAAEGIRLTNAFCSNGICVPARATIMTGQYSHTNGVRTLAGAIGEAQQTLPRLVGEAGYETAIIGKWHLKAEPAAFDYYAVLRSQGHYFNPTFHIRGENAWPENTFRPTAYDSIHSTDAITDLSIQWLNQRADSDRPFLLMHQYKAPHDNFENAERYDWLYADATIPEPDSLWNRGQHGPQTPEGPAPQYGTSVGPRNAVRNMGHHMAVDPELTDEAYTREAYQRYLKKYLRCVRGVDDGIERLLAHLDDIGELDNTIVIYTSDQGFMLGEHDTIDKRWIYEETLRIPFIVWYPPLIDSGGTLDAMISNVDIAPTLLDMAGVATPSDMQGRSFWPMLTGEPEPLDWPQVVYYRYWMHMAHHDNPAHFGIRTRTHKLAFFYGLPLDARGAKPDATGPYWELYNIEHDPHEMENLIHDPEAAGILGSLRDELEALRMQIDDTDEAYPELRALLEAESASP